MSISSSLSSSSRKEKTVYKANFSSAFSQLRETRECLSSLVKRGQENEKELMNGTLEEHINCPANIVTTAVVDKLNTLFIIIYSPLNVTLHSVTVTATHYRALHML